MRSITLLSIVPLLATSVAGATLPFLRNGNAVAAREISGHVVPNAERRNPNQRMVRRRNKHHHTTTTTTSDCGDAGPTSTGDSWNSTSWAPTSTSASLPSSTDDGSEASTDDSASSSTVSSRAPATSSTTPGGNVPNSEWTLTRTIAGSDFFGSNNWQFWDYADPTHGEVDYVDQGTAQSAGLIDIDSDGDAIMRVETTQTVNGPRKSVRLHSAFDFTGGMVLMDAKHMPIGCGTWPAWWQNGPDWPTGGEIDILEGVNDNTVNQVSLHTAPGCRAPSNMDSQQSGTLSQPGGFDAFHCGSAATSNQGCGVIQTGDTSSYGNGFNAANGGVYALVWDQSGIAVWFHTRSKIPADITADKPNPANWGTPVARWPASDCDPFKYFYNHISIFDTTLCGDWAGADGVWQNGGCAASTGFNTCLDYVHNNGDALKNAFWKVSYVKYFQSPTSNSS